MRGARFWRPAKKTAAPSAKAASTAASARAAICQPSSVLTRSDVALSDAAAAGTNRALGAVAPYAVANCSAGPVGFVVP
jgi:hypothetical protein